jgi:hypothetical protein
MFQEMHEKKARTFGSGPCLRVFAASACAISADDAKDYRRISKVSVVVLVMPPPVAVMVIGKVPLVALRGTDRLKSVVPEPGAAIDAGLKLEVTSDGTPVAEKETAELKPPLTETVTTANPLWP